jgi:hypothetical protein
MTDILAKYAPSKMQSAYDRLRHTAAYVLVRAVMLKNGLLFTEEVWWDTRETCELLAADEHPTNAFRPEDIEGTQWWVKSRREWQEILEMAGQVEAGGTQRLN